MFLWNKNFRGKCQAETLGSLGVRQVLMFSRLLWIVICFSFVPTAAPVFVTRPTDQESIIGGDAVFQCVAVGLPIPGISWERDGQVLQTRQGSISIRGGYLQLFAVQRDTAGTYTCVAGNRVTSVNATASLIVHSKRSRVSTQENGWKACGIFVQYFTVNALWLRLILLNGSPFMEWE